MTPARPKLSIVIPVYNGASTIQADVRRLHSVLHPVEPSHEIIVVVDGATDSTANALLGMKDHYLCALEYEPNRGKGFAVAYGMMQAQGDLIGFMDAGGDIHPRVWCHLLNGIRLGADIAVASKLHRDSKVSYPWRRRIYSRIVRGFVSHLLQLGVRDSQTGAKLFRRPVIAQVVPFLTIDRFAFDVELLALARRRGFTTTLEVPVCIKHDGRSTVNIGAIARMLWDIALMSFKLRFLFRYDMRKMDAIPARFARLRARVIRSSSGLAQ